MLGLSIFKRNADKSAAEIKASEEGRYFVDGIIALACEHKQSVEIMTEDGETYKTIFVGFDTESPWFYTDLLMPRYAEDLLTRGESAATFSFLLNGVMCKFDTVFDGVDEWGGFDSLRFHMPSHIKHYQRRDEFRVEPRISEPVMVAVANQDVEAAAVANISVSGVFFNTKNPLDAGFITPVFLKFPDDTPMLRLNLEVIEAHKTRRPPRHKRAGERVFEIRARFVGITNSAAQLIRRYVTRRQRELLQLLA